jgi:predicted PurR-regulated permease PerM
VSSSSNESERKQTAEVGEEAMPLPAYAKVIFLGGIFFLLFLAALYTVADIVWPLVLAFVLSLLLKPSMRLLVRLRIPQVLCAVLLVVAVLGLVVGIGTAISGPATTVGPQSFPKACLTFSSASDFSKRLSPRCNTFGNR